MLFCISSFIYFRQHNFCIDILYVNYLLHVSAFRPSSGIYPLKAMANVRGVSSAANSESAHFMMAERPKHVADN
jgi:hypothetical protein